MPAKDPANRGSAHLRSKVRAHVFHLRAEQTFLLRDPLGRHEYRPAKRIGSRY